MITRAQYMANGEKLHDAYYREIAAECGIKFTEPASIARFREALATDPSMNNIPLSWWDTRAVNLMLYNGWRIHEVLKARGDSYSMAVSVCILKAAARAAVKRFVVLCDGKPILDRNDNTRYWFEREEAEFCAKGLNTSHEGQSHPRYIVKPEEDA